MRRRAGVGIATFAAAWSAPAAWAPSMVLLLVLASTRGSPLGRWPRRGVALGWLASIGICLSLDPTGPEGLVVGLVTLQTWILTTRGSDAPWVLPTGLLQLASAGLNGISLVFPFAMAGVVIAWAPPDPWPIRVRRIGLIVAAGLLVAVSLPRLGAVHGPVDPDASTGFQDEVRLGALAGLHDDDAAALWVRVRGASAVPGPLYLRGAVLESFDGTRFLPPGGRVPSSAPDPRGAPITVEVFGTPMPGGVVFTAGDVVGLDVGAPVVVDPAGSWRLASGPGPALVTVGVGSGGVGLGARSGRPPSEATLALPRDLAPEIREVGPSVVGDRTGAAAIDAIVSHVARRPYRRDVIVGDLPSFLLGDGAGHCEWFAGATTVLLRSAGVPARVVTGFVLGAPGRNLPTEWAPIARSNAHAWVEVWHDGAWWGVDPTAMATAAAGVAPQVREPESGMVTHLRSVDATFRAWIVGYDADDQVSALRTIGAPVVGSTARAAPVVGGGLAVGLAVAGWTVLVRLIRRSQPERVDRVTRCHRLARSRLAAAGFVAPSTLPAVDAARHLGAAGAPGAEYLERLAWLMYRVRCGGEDAAVHTSQADELLRRISSALSHAEPG